MNRAIRALPGAASTLILCLALSVGTPVAVASEGAVSYQKESEKEFETQLAAGQIEGAVINKRLRTLRLTLKDGRHVLTSYPKHQEPATLARIKARGVSVSVLSPATAAKEQAKKPAHHKLRYIAGGVVIVVLVIAGLVLVLNRRRQRD